MADPISEVINFFKQKKTALIAALVALLSFLSALGTGFQNVTAMAQLFIEGALAALPSWSLGVVIGGIATTVVNYCLNIELLESFWERLTGRKPEPSLEIDKKIRWGVGIFVFVVTGILFGLTAVSISATGGLAIAAIVAGVFVSAVMIPQELETWLQSFDDPVTLAIDKRIYDIKNLENKAMLSLQLGMLRAELESVLLKDELKKLKEELAQEAEEAQLKEEKAIKRVVVETLNHLLLHLEKDKIDLLEECINKYSKAKDEGSQQALMQEFNQLLLDFENGKINLLRELINKCSAIENEPLQQELIQKFNDLQNNFLGKVDQIRRFTQVGKLEGVNYIINKQEIDDKQEVALNPIELSDGEDSTPILTQETNDEQEIALINLMVLKEELAQDSFKKQEEKISIIETIRRWWRDLTLGRLIGWIISLGNVMALSLLFTIGLTAFLTTFVGVAALPALIIGFSVAFTFGAFTEFYFYCYFLADFCDQIAYRWNELINSPNYGLGISLVIVNGAVNGVLAYFGVMLLGGLLAAAGIAAPPLLALTIVAGVFAGVASVLLGSDFWIRSAKRFFTFNSEEEPANGDEIEEDTKPLIDEDIEEIKEIKAEKTTTSPEAYNWIFAPAKEYSKKVEPSINSSQLLYERI